MRQYRVLLFLAFGLVSGAVAFGEMDVDQSSVLHRVKEPHFDKNEVAWQTLVEARDNAREIIGYLVLSHHKDQSTFLYVEKGLQLPRARRIDPGHLFWDGADDDLIRPIRYLRSIHERKPSAGALGEGRRWVPVEKLPPLVPGEKKIVNPHLLGLSWMGVKNDSGLATVVLFFEYELDGPADISRGHKNAIGANATGWQERNQLLKMWNGEMWDGNRDWFIQHTQAALAAEQERRRIFSSVPWLSAAVMQHIGIQPYVVLLPNDPDDRCKPVYQIGHLAESDQFKSR